MRLLPFAVLLAALCSVSTPVMGGESSGGSPETPQVQNPSGTVTDVRTDPQGGADLVTVTLAKPDAVSAGTRFIVYRGSLYVALVSAEKVRTEKVANDTVECRLIPSSANSSGLTIRTGDLIAPPQLSREHRRVGVTFTPGQDRPASLPPTDPTTPKQ